MCVTHALVGGEKGQEHKGESRASICVSGALQEMKNENGKGGEEKKMWGALVKGSGCHFWQEINNVFLQIYCGIQGGGGLDDRLQRQKTEPRTHEKNEWSHIQ